MASGVARICFMMEADKSLRISMMGDLPMYGFEGVFGEPAGRGEPLLMTAGGMPFEDMMVACAIMLRAEMSSGRRGTIELVP